MAYDRYRQGQRDQQDYRPGSNDSNSGMRDRESAGYFDRGQSQRGYRSGSETGYGNAGYGDPYNRGFDRRPNDYYGGPDAHDSDYGRDRPTFRGGFAPASGQYDDVEDYGRDHRRGSGYGDRGYGERNYGGRQQQPRSRGQDQDRGFLDRSVDEVRSWFGDRDAERRREQDARYDMQSDGDYRSWRSGQIDAFDRDYHEYRQENRSKFQNEFASWRTERQGQRDALSKVTEHMDVVGSDGSHVGTVDKVRGDRIILTKNDQDAGGRHHSIPSRWIQTVDDKVTLRKTAEEAQHEWRDEERNQAFFSEGRSDRSIDDDRGAHMLDRSFSGTYRS